MRVHGVKRGNLSDIAAHGSDGGPRFAYLRVAEDIARRIRSGELAPGTRLRSERDLAEHYEVAFHTVRRAMRVLRDRGLILSIHGKGTYVRDLQ